MCKIKTNLAESSSAAPHYHQPQQHHHQQQQQSYAPQQQQNYAPQQQQQNYAQPPHQSQVTKHVHAPVDRPISNNNGGLPAGQNICADCERLIV